MWTRGSKNPSAPELFRTRAGRLLGLIFHVGFKTFKNPGTWDTQKNPIPLPPLFRTQSAKAKTASIWTSGSQRPARRVRLNGQSFISAMDINLYTGMLATKRLEQGFSVR